MSEINNGSTNDQDQGKNTTPEKTFTQADIDAIVGKTKAETKAKTENSIAEAIKAEREKWEAEAKMTEAEKQKARDDEFKAHLAEKEAELNRRDALNRAKELLAEKKVSQKFADFLIAETTDETEKKVAEFLKTFDEAVEATTNERLKGKTPERMTDNKKTSGSSYSGRVISQGGRTGF